jgi:hypothetical protein
MLSCVLRCFDITIPLTQPPQEVMFAGSHADVGGGSGI